MELRTLYFLIFTLTLDFQTVAEDSKCVYANCTCEYSKVTCTNLLNIPPLVTGPDVMNVSMAMFMAGHLAKIEDNSLPPNLNTFHVINNPITYISPNAFLNSSTTLDSIVFNNVLLTKLPDAMLQLKNLTHFAVINVPITDWDTPVLGHINSTLRSISLQNVGLADWPEWLSHFPVLDYVSFLNSPILTMPDDAFESVKDSLKTLDLINVSLPGIPKAISKFDLTGLSLSGNNLKDVRGIPRSKFIDLSYNAISDADMLTEALIPSADKLNTLYMESNNLTVIPNLSNMTVLEMIVLTQCQIADSNSGILPASLTAIDFGKNRLKKIPQAVTNLPNLQSLTLSSNLISEINGAAIPLHLEGLHLDSNQISYLNSATFRKGLSLKLLDLQSNPLSFIAPDAFAEIHNLTLIVLDDTQLTIVPSALTTLLNLNKLHMNNIPSLNCVCPPESSLVRWFQSINFEEMEGLCNNGLSIHDFYTKNQTCSDASITSRSWLLLVALLMMLILNTV